MILSSAEPCGREARLRPRRDCSAVVKARAVPMRRTCCKLLYRREMRRNRMTRAPADSQRCVTHPCHGPMRELRRLGRSGAKGGRPPPQPSPRQHGEGSTCRMIPSRAGAADDWVNDHPGLIARGTSGSRHERGSRGRNPHPSHVAARLLLVCNAAWRAAVTFRSRIWGKRMVAAGGSLFPARTCDADQKGHTPCPPSRRATEAAGPIPQPAPRWSRTPASAPLRRILP